MWNRDLKLKCGIIAATGLSAFVLLVVHGMRFDYASAAKAGGTIGLLAPFAVVFANRRIDVFANLLTGFLCMVGFNLCLAVLTYAGTPLNAPLADRWLMRLDHSMGVHLPAIVEWMSEHPSLRRVFGFAYASVLPSTLLALIVLGFDRNVQRLREFVFHFMLAGLLTTLVFFVLPAAGPFASYGYEMRPDQQRFLEHFQQLRDGRFPVVSMSNLEGLITFPSFHTSWAVLLIIAFRHYRWLFVPMAVVNVGVVLSTMTTGWHYASDVVGGLLIVAASWAITRCVMRWTTQDSETAQSTCPITTG